MKKVTEIGAIEYMVAVKRDELTSLPPLDREKMSNATITVTIIGEIPSHYATTIAEMIMDYASELGVDITIKISEE